MNAKRVAFQSLLQKFRPYSKRSLTTRATGSPASGVNHGLLYWGDALHFGHFSRGFAPPAGIAF